MKPLALIDDRWHPGEVPRHGLAAIADFDWLEDGSAWSEELVAGRPVVVLCKANHTTAANFNAWADERAGEVFLRYLRSGGGLLVIHSGLSGYESVPPMRTAISGRFLHHPPPCAVTFNPRENHPLAAGVETFTELDEHYFVEADPEADIFLMTASEHGIQPGGWTCRRGAGRVCVLTPGHTPAVWHRPSFQRLLRKALAWCRGYPEAQS